MLDTGARIDDPLRSASLRLRCARRHEAVMYDQQRGASVPNLRAPGERGEMSMRLAKAALVITLVSGAVRAQVNLGEQKPEGSVPFTMTTVATFKLPWRLAFV